MPFGGAGGGGSARFPVRSGRPRTKPLKMDEQAHPVRTGEGGGDPTGVASLAATRASLLTRLKDHGDQDGWQRFFDTYAGLIRGFARKAGLSPEAADEVLQETLLSVSREMPSFRYDRTRGTFKGWLFQVTRRRIADEFRRRARQGRLEAAVAEQAMAEDPEPPGLADAWEEEWRRHALEQAVRTVRARTSPRQWQLFDLAVLQQWPVERICSVLGVNRAQIYMARMRVGRQFKSELASDPADR